ncbi:MAG: FAD-dependent oxidoreductase [Bacteroidetes Order II. Incertae sedis bacterium]|nr:FAD-dependent oxidoreductase [Bacteroidetes Order II. bacterium]
MRLGIVGAGIFGLTTALEMSLRGHEVTLFDQGDVPNRLSSSYDYHRLIRHPYGPKKGYASLIPFAFEAWDRLWKQLNTSFYIETGCLAIGRLDHDWIPSSIGSLKEAGVPFERLSSGEASNRFDWLTFEENEECLFTPEGGILQSGPILEALAAYLGPGQDSKHSVTKCKIIANCLITEINAERAEITANNEAKYIFDHVLLTTGAWHNTFYPEEIVAYKQKFGLQFDLDAHIRVENDCPMILDLAEDGGFYFIPGSSAFPAKYGDHVVRSAGHPDVDRTISEKEKSELLALMKSRVRMGLTDQADQYGVCFYSCTEDQRPNVLQTGHSTRLFGGSGHSFKWGALFGELIADLLTTERSLADVQEIVRGMSLPTRSTSGTS